MAKCDICGKGAQFGHNVPPSGKRTKRKWKTNIQKVTVIIDGKPKRLKLCTECLKTLYRTSGR